MLVHTISLFVFKIYNRHHFMDDIMYKKDITLLKISFKSSSGEIEIA